MNRSVFVASPKRAGASCQKSRGSSSPLEVEHPVILGNQMKPAAALGDARELGEHPLGMRDRMDDVAITVRSNVRSAAFSSKTLWFSNARRGAIRP